MTSKRSIAALNETALLSQVVRPILFARLDFAGGVQRFHTDVGTRTATHPIHGAESYIGIGDFGGLSSQVVESSTGAPQSLQIALSGVNATLVNDALTDDYHMREIEVMLGLDDTSGTLVTDPEILFSGFMDRVDITLDDGVANMVMNCESRAIAFLRSSDVRFTDEDKQIEVSGDLFGEYIYRMADINLIWGDKGFGTGLYGGAREGKKKQGPKTGR